MVLFTRLQSLQLELHTHRRWLSGFLRRTQTPSYFTSFPRRAVAAAASKASRNAKIDRAFPSQSRRAPSAKGAVKFSKPWSRRDDDPVPSGTNTIIEDLRQKALAANIAHVIEDYNALNSNDKRTLSNRDIRQIAQCLHQSIRKEKQNAKNQHRQSGVRDLVEFADLLVEDIKNGAIVPSGKAHVHIIGLYKETGATDKGRQFWKWLLEQDESYVDVDCYGAAIELLVVDGVPLAALEKLYQEALGRFPGNFAAYHLSPNAVLPDRDQVFTVGGLPITLLQGMLTARLMSGDARNAYLDLDIALRILPDLVPQRLFWVFLNERPIQEAYTAFALACRGGSPMTGSYYRTMLSDLRRQSTFESSTQHALVVRSMLSVTHMFIGNGGVVAGNNVNELAIAITQFMRISGVQALAPADKRRIVTAITDVVHAVFEVFARYGAKPGIPAFNSIITNLGGFGASKQTIGVAMNDAYALGLAPTDVTWRSVLAAAGMLRDKDLVEKTFGHLRDSRIETEEHPRDSDFHALVKPAHRTGAIDFARREVDKFRHILEPAAYDTICERLEDPMEAEIHSKEDLEPVDVGEMLAEIAKVKADVEIMKERTKDSPAVQDFSEQALPMTLQPLSSELDIPDAQLRTIYDEFTANRDLSGTAPPADALDPAQPATATPAPAPATAPAKSKTNVPFGQLRFESWKMINILLELCEKNDLAYDRIVDEVITAGKVPRKRTEGLVGQGEEVVSWGLSSVVSGSDSTREEQREVSAEEMQRVREKIVRLRTR